MSGRFVFFPSIFFSILTDTRESVISSHLCYLLYALCRSFSRFLGLSVAFVGV